MDLLASSQSDPGCCDTTFIETKISSRKQEYLFVPGKSVQYVIGSEPINWSNVEPPT